MLLPFQWAVLTVEEARTLMKYIEESTATAAHSRNYDKMQKVGVLNIYDKLREFSEAADHFEGNLRWFNPDNCARDDHEH